MPPRAEWPTLPDGQGEATVGRFVVERTLGAGAMGVVFAGRDPQSGRTVAIKLMRGEAGEAQGGGRFTREVQALAGLRHPGIVEFIEQGILPDGRRFLVMERLEGEDLQQRLRRGPLPVADSVELAIQVAEALDVAHAHDIVHRDIKPSNLFLGTGGEVKILDFGVARIDQAESLTRTGGVIGTLGYMAPEQARGETALDGRSDLFSLGCVLYECITGEPVFTGEHAMAILAKILLDEVPRLRDARPDIPPGLDELVAALLAKRAADRPGTAGEVAARLRALAGESAGAGAPRAAAVGVTLRERRVFSLLLVRMGELLVDPLMSTSTDDEMLPPELERVAAAFGAQFSPVLGGVGLVSVELDAPASDVAALSARCARAVLQRFPSATQVLTTGRGERRGRSIVGNVIDHAASLEARAPGGAIVVDSATAQLLAGRFALTTAGEWTLLGEEQEQGARVFLGKPGPFLGRARELSWLLGHYRQAVEDSQSCAALVTAGPGAGKSRLRFEFARALAEESPAPLILTGRGSPMASGAPLRMLREAIREELRIGDSDEAAEQRAALRRRLRERIAADEVERVFAFMAELLAVPLDESVHPALASARRDAPAMAEGMRNAWLDWLRAECERRPAVLVLEDLHWGDAASVEFVDAAIEALTDRPLLVLALARPEARALFSWRCSRLFALELPRLSARAGEGLVRHALGEAVEPSRVRALVERADGNPLFLEELIRAASGGAGEELPETVLGVMQARLHGVDDESRRVLRAASVFGGEFSEAGLCAVLGEASPGLRARLFELARRELLAPDGARGANHRFRHALVRDAAYAMLTEDDRRLAHDLAAEWLARQDGCEPKAVAEHFSRGAAPERALEWFHRAAEQAHAGGDPAAAVELAERAIACGAAGEARGRLRLIQAEARSWSGNLDEAVRAAMEAVDHLSQGTERWFAAIQKIIYCMSARRDVEEALRWLGRAAAVEPAPEATWAPLLCLCEAIYAMHVAAQREMIFALLEQLERRVEGASVPVHIMGHVHRARVVAYQREGRLDCAAREAGEAAINFETAGDLHNTSKALIWRGFTLAELGDTGPAERLLREAAELAARVRSEQTLVMAKGTLAGLLLRTGRAPEAHALLTEALARTKNRADPRSEGVTRVLLGWAELQAGRAAEAEALVRAGLTLLAGQRGFETLGLAMLARICAALGRAKEAVSVARCAADLASPSHGPIEQGGFVWSLIADAFDEAEAREAAAEAVAAGVAHVRALVEGARDSRLRACALATAESRALIERAMQLGIAVADLFKMSQETCCKMGEA